MTGLSDPAVSFVLVLLIGIVAGLIAHRISRVSWLSHITGSHRAAVTNVLVGVAGAFVGYHIAVLLRLGGSGSLVPLLGAVAGAALVLWAWRTLKF